MYIKTSEGLGQPPKTNPLQEFLDKVRKSPQNYQNLLLNIRLHPFPLLSATFTRSPVFNKQTLVDLTLMNNGDSEQVVKELIQISDANLEREIKAQRELWDKTIQEGLVNLDPSELKPFLLKAALLDPKRVKAPEGDAQYVLDKFREIGLGIVLKLPSPLARELVDGADDAHYTKLGHRLAKIAISKKEKDPVFRKEVDREQKKRQQAEQERMRQQQRRRRRPARR